MSSLAIARIAVALLSGALFGFGLSLSGMVDPARVIGFLDIASGHWDPSLMFVLGGAVCVAFVASVCCLNSSAKLISMMMKMNSIPTIISVIETK